MFKVYAAVAIGTVLVGDTVSPIGEKPVWKISYEALIDTEANKALGKTAHGRQIRKWQERSISEMRQVHSMLGGSPSDVRRVPRKHITWGEIKRELERSR